jgi:hypothetical protein
VKWQSTERSKISQVTFGELGLYRIEYWDQVEWNQSVEKVNDAGLAYKELNRFHWELGDGSIYFMQAVRLDDDKVYAYPLEVVK